MASPAKIYLILPLLLLGLIPAQAAAGEGAAGIELPPAAATPETEGGPGPAPAEAAAALSGTANGDAAAADTAEPVPESGPEQTPPQTLPAPPASQPAAIPAQDHPPEPVQQEERIRSMIIMLAAIVLIAALLAIIVLLIRRGHELRSAAQPYVAEAYLNDIQGSTTQSVYRLGSKPVMLGRVAGKDTEHIDYIVIPQSTIGRRHALIEYKDFAYWIMDQGSINGTFVNDKLVSSEVRLKHGDRVRLHKFQFEFVMPDVGETGRTVVSATGFAGKGAATEEEAALLKQGAAGGAEEEELFVDLSISEVPSPPPGKPGVREQETVIRAGGSAAGPGKGAGLDDETLMPGTVSGSGIPVQSDDETLLPGGASGADEDSIPESDDETLMPGATPPPSAAGEKGKKPGQDHSGDEFFDITGSGRDAKK